MVPYCKKLIMKELLEEEHKKTIKVYYERIRGEVGPLIEEKLKGKERSRALKYLEEETNEFV